MLLRNREEEVNRWNEEQFEDNRRRVVEITQIVAEKLAAKKAAKVK